ncbi:MAG: molybdenum cofactor guanylyltransferase MobA [Rhodospirillaceae bacterium]|nr:molybdenum cofactor guanylyltransferase MobA [Rhodospirillaceae bacterium]MBT5036943.1 molybdenum cofactor guanylyltransferase MobA [Rhodospirillaceae bacterium]MBT5779499.1 molybdenum cofactor guanylyltransferase MobA [Rhodospirillaceae bacterium]
MIEVKNIAGVLLAGGLARRMGGGDKCLRPLAGKAILAHVVERVRPQVGPLMLNANGDPARFAKFGLPIAPDVVEGYAGPLAGILTGMEWAAEEAPECAWLASFATDAPFLPEDLVTRMAGAIADEGADMARAASNGRAHPVFALWPVALRAALRQALVEEDMRKVDAWTGRYKVATVEFAAAPRDPFFNANRPEDFAEAERLMGLAD